MYSHVRKLKIVMSILVGCVEKLKIYFGALILGPHWRMGQKL